MEEHEKKLLDEIIYIKDSCDLQKYEASIKFQNFENIVLMHRITSLKHSSRVVYSAYDIKLKE